MKLLIVYCLAFCCLALVYADPESNPADPVAADEPVAEYLPPPAEEAEAPATKVAEDGYRYKTFRRLRYRHRREVSQEYLPPAMEPSAEYLPPDNSIDTKATNDGYRYKTIRRLRFRARHRRDVSEIAPPTHEYLPPTAPPPPPPPPPPVDVALGPELKTVVGDDGYRYRTVRRLKFRRHRREADAAVAEETASAGSDGAPTNEYLPPAGARAEVDVPAPAAADAPVETKPEVKSAELGKDGYRYKTVRRIRYRHRH